LQVIDNQMDQTTGTIRMKAEFPNPDLKLWPGQFVNVRLLVDTLRQVVVVPTSAVQRGPNGTFVYVVDAECKVAVRPVTVSQQDDTGAVVSSGLKAEERVVTTGFTRLSNGTRVRVQAGEGQPQPDAAPGETPRGGEAAAPEGKRKREGGEGEGEGKRRRRSEGAASSPGTPSAKQ
jgi:multidrug efflux system membrane fusion protein